MITAFTSSFITANQDAFDEYLALGVSISQKLIDGEEASDKYDQAFKLQVVLKARRSSDLTTKEAEALDGCLRLLSELQVVPSLTPLLVI